MQLCKQRLTNSIVLTKSSSDGHHCDATATITTTSTTTSPESPDVSCNAMWEYYWKDLIIVLFFFYCCRVQQK